MKRRIARVDANQARVVAALRKSGATVRSLAALGAGCPDLLVGFRGDNHLLEVKDGAKPPSARALTPDEDRFIREWRGTVFVVNNEIEALQAIGAINAQRGTEVR